MGTEESATVREGGAARARAIDLAPGDKIGRYEIKEVAGRGGMGVVYLAYDPQLERRVALKLLLPGGEGPQALVDEARALAKLTDPHVVAVYDAGEADGRVFIAMQYVEGVTLLDALRERQPTPQQILAWFVAAGRGLAAAHEAGLVHHDFKPGNVLMGDGRIAVTDFGLARDARRRTATEMGVLSGTPIYISPEQYESKPASEASDQFAFCCSLWEALFGRHPYIGGDPAAMTPYEIGIAILDADLLPPLRKPRLPASVTAALTRGLARDPAQRWPSMRALLDVLAPPARPRWRGVVLAGTVAAALTGAIVWAVATRTDDAPSCEQQARGRLAAAWQPANGVAITAQFVTTRRPYAAAAARRVSAAIDRYALHWQSLAGDMCAAERASGPGAQLQAQRRACLDSRLDALRGTASVLATESRPELVDQSHKIVDALPDLTDCISAGAGETAAPTPLAPTVAKLDEELSRAFARAVAGDFATMLPVLRDIAKRADGLGYAPLIVRAHSSVARTQLALAMPVTEHAQQALALAIERGLDRDAARAAATLLRLVAFGGKQDVDQLAPLARSLADKTRDSELRLNAKIAHARALTTLRRWQVAGALCQEALTDALALADNKLVEEAQICVVETLIPLGRYTDAEPIVDKLIATTTEQFSADHPRVADFLTLQFASARRRGDMATARRLAERGAAIRKATYPPGHFKHGESVVDLADTAFAEGDHDRAYELYDQARKIYEAYQPRSMVVVKLSGVYSALADYDFDNRDRASGMAYYQKAFDLVREYSGKDSLEYAILLLNYGQRKAVEDYDAGFAAISEAATILQRRNDPRAKIAGLAAGIIAKEAKRYTDVVRIIEPVLPLLADTDPVEVVARTKYLLAFALDATNGDKARRKQLAVEAKALFAKLGQFDKLIADLDRVIARAG